jgi:hypothetical protein
VLNDAGRIAFRGQLIGNGVTDQSDSGIWADSAGSIQLVAREGDQPPGVSGNAAFAEFDRNSHVLNALGQIAFLGGLVGDGITAANDVGIWATAQNGALSLIAREGDELEVRPNEFRTISELRFLGGSGNGDSRPNGFNNVGQVAFYAQFSDGSSGVFVSDRVAIPEPTSLWLLAIAVGMLHAVIRQGNSAR